MAWLQRLNSGEETTNVIFQQSDRAEERSPLARIRGCIRLPSRLTELLRGSPGEAARLAETLNVRKLLDRHSADACKEHATN